MRPDVIQSAIQEEVRLDEFNTSYFGCDVSVWRSSFSIGLPYPWRFEIKSREGVVYSFAGIPNKMDSLKAAARRAWWRAKWLQDGTFAERYRADWHKEG